MQNCRSSEGERKTRPGPAPDPNRATTRAIFPEWSDRKFATYWAAMRHLLYMEARGNIDIGEEVLRRATRPNGTINVSKYAREAEWELLKWQIGPGRDLHRAERAAS